MTFLKVGYLALIEFITKQKKTFLHHNDVVPSASWDALGPLTAHPERAGPWCQKLVSH